MMTFQQSVRTCLLQKYFFVFKGRASRSEFWWFMLFIGLVNMASGFFLTPFPPYFAASFSLVVSLLLLPANFGVTVRRLHDRNLSGWWLAIPLGLLALWMLSGGYAQQAGTATGLISLAMCLGYLAIFCMPGQLAPNKYGPSPIMAQKENL